MKRTLSEWLAHIEQLHPKSIALGLERVGAVYARMELAKPSVVFTVAGTNGKGSVCAMLESIVRTEGYRVGLYTSPHIVEYSERVKLCGERASDDALVDSFEAVDAVRGDVPLTYFEFGTLSAMWLFARARLDAWVLEVGLGGRLDATNVIDADCAVLTSIGIDHTDYLGSTRDAIAREKLGIARRGAPIILGEPDLPTNAAQIIANLGARALQCDRDFYAEAIDATQWRYTAPDGARAMLPYPALRGAFQIQNAACALAALHTQRARLPVRASAIREGLLTVEWPGRFQVLPGRPTIVLDAAHNPHAAHVLAEALGGMGFHPETFAVFGALADKDVKGIVEAVKGRITRWHVVPTHGPRGQSAEHVREVLIEAGVADAAIARFESVADALVATQKKAADIDRIVVFGSFHILSEAMPILRRR